MPYVLTFKVDKSSQNEAKAALDSTTNAAKRLDDALSAIAKVRPMDTKAIAEVAQKTGLAYDSVKKLSDAIQRTERLKAFDSLASQANLSTLELAKLRMEAEGLGGGFEALKRGAGEAKLAIAGVSAATIAAGKVCLDATLQVDRLNKAYTSVMGSEQAAGAQLSYIYNVTQRLGLEYQSTAEAAKNFFASAKGTDLEKSMNSIFEGVLAAGSALSLTREQMDGVFLALSQIASKGKLSMEEVHQIAERFPGTFQMIATALNVTQAELTDVIASGKIMANDMLPSLGKAWKEKYGDKAIDAAKGVQGALNRINTEWGLLKASFIDTDVAASGLNSIADAMKGIGELPDVIGDYGTEIATLASVAAAIKGVSAARTVAEGVRKTSMANAAKEQGVYQALIDKVASYDTALQRKVETDRSAAAAALDAANAETTRLEREKMLLVAHEKRADALAARVVGTEKEERAEKVLASTRARLSQVNDQLAASEQKAAAASAQLSKSVSSFQVLRSAGSRLLDFLGGPWGIAFTAAAAGVTYLITRQDEASAAAKNHVAAQKKLQEQIKQATEAVTKQGVALSELEKINFAAKQKKEMAEYEQQAKAVAEALHNIYQEYAQADNYESFVQGLDEFSAQYEQLKNIFQAFSEGSLSAEQLKQALEQLRAETVKAHGENNTFVRSLDDLLNTKDGVVSGLADMASRMLGLGDAAATTANKVQIAKSVMASPWVLNTGKAEEAIADIEKAIRGMQAERQGIGYAKGMVDLLPKVEPGKISKALSAYQSSGLEGFIGELGDAFHSLNGEQQKNLILLADASVAYKKESDALKAWKDSQKDNGKSAAVSQADYNGELERTRQAIDSLQQQLGLDKTEDLARAKIRIEQQYQATLSKTNEELAKQVAQGKLTQGQADTLKAEKDKAAALQMQVALRDAEQKAQEKSVRLAEGQLKFFKELGELSGDYGQSLTLQNRLIEKQAKEYREVYKISDELVDKWVELQKLQVSQDPFDGAYRGLLKFSAEYADSGKQWEKISYSFAGNFQSATREMFDNFLDTGRMSFASLERSFATLLKDMAYQALVQPVVLSIVGGVQQGVYGMTTAGGGGTLLSTGAGLAQQYGMSQLTSGAGGYINAGAAYLAPSLFAPSASQAAINEGLNAALAASSGAYTGYGGATAPTMTFTQAFGAPAIGAGIGSIASPFVNNIFGIQNNQGSQMGSMIGGLGSTAILGTLAAANIWNPGGWVLGGLAALGSIFGGSIGGLFGGGGDKDPWVNITTQLDLLGQITNRDPWTDRAYRVEGQGWESTSNQGEGISYDTGKQLADMAAELAKQALKDVATFQESVAAIGNSALEEQFNAALEQNRFLSFRYEWEDREIKPEEMTEAFNKAIQEKLYLSLSAVDVTSLTTAADGALADTMPEVTKAITDAMSFAALGANLGEYRDDFNSAISGKLLEALNQMDTSGIALDIDKSSLAGWQDAVEALQGWQAVTDALDEILEPTSELASTLATATTQFDGWIDQLEELGWREEAIAEIEAKRTEYMHAYASALTRASEQDLYLRTLALQYGSDSQAYGLQSLQYQQQAELAELEKKFGKDSAIYSAAVEIQQAELAQYRVEQLQAELETALAAQTQAEQQSLQAQVTALNSQASALRTAASEAERLRDTLEDLADDMADARRDLWSSSSDNLLGTSYQESLAAFEEAYRQGMAGDQDALRDLPGLASDLLAQGRDNLATSEEYTDLFYEVNERLKAAQAYAAQQADDQAEAADSLNAQLDAITSQTDTLQAAIDAGTAATEYTGRSVEAITAELELVKALLEQEKADVSSGASLSQTEALIQAKVDQLNAIAYSGRTDWTAESFLAEMYKQGLSLPEWYDQYGRTENLGAIFDVDAAWQQMLENKAALMNAGLTLAPGQTAGGWTADKVAEAIAEAGMSLNQWYVKYGLAEGVGTYYQKYSQDAADSTNDVLDQMLEDMDDDTKAQLEASDLLGSIMGAQGSKLAAYLQAINSGISGLDWSVTVNVSSGSVTTGGTGGSTTTGGSGSGSSGSGSSGGTSSLPDSNGRLPTPTGVFGSHYLTEYDLLAAKAEALNRDGVTDNLPSGYTRWTAYAVEKAIENEGLTLPSWYEQFGKAEGFASGGITPVNKPFWVGERGPELMMSPRQYGVLSNPDSLALMDRPVMDSSSIITAIRDSGQSIYNVLRQLLTKTDAIYGQQRRILQRLDMWDAEGLPS